MTTTRTFTLAEDDINLICDSVERTLEHYTNLSIIQASIAAGKHFERKATACRSLLYRLRQVGACG